MKHALTYNVADKPETEGNIATLGWIATLLPEAQLLESVMPFYYKSGEGNMAFVLALFFHLTSLTVSQGKKNFNQLCPQAWA